MMHSLLVPLFLLATTILNIVVPLPGSSVVTPLLATWINNPQHAIALVSIYFFLSGCIRAYMFREFIVKKFVREFLLLSVLASIVGALAIIKISAAILYGLFFAFVLWSFVKMVMKVFFKQEPKPQGKIASQIVAVLSGFLQGTGLSGSDMRNSFFYADGLTIQQTQGTGAFISVFIFGAATLTRFSTNQLTASDLWFFLYAVPILLLGTWLGKKIIIKVPKHIQNYLIIVILIGVLVSIGIKLMQFI